MLSREGQISFLATGISHPVLRCFEVSAAINGHMFIYHVHVLHT